MAGNVDRALLAADQRDPATGEDVLDAADGDLVPGNFATGKQHDIAFFKADLVAAIGDAREGSTRLALPAGGDNQHLAARQVHCRFEIHGIGKVFEVAAGLGRLDDPVERAPGDAELAIARLGDSTQRLQPRHVRGESSDKHPPALVLGDFRQKPAQHAAFGAGRLGIEHIG